LSMKQQKDHLQRQPSTFCRRHSGEIRTYDAAPKGIDRKQQEISDGQ